MSSVSTEPSPTAHDSFPPALEPGEVQPANGTAIQSLSQSGEGFSQKAGANGHHSPQPAALPLKRPSRRSRKPLPHSEQFEEELTPELRCGLCLACL